MFANYVTFFAAVCIVHVQIVDTTSSAVSNRIGIGQMLTQTDGISTGLGAKGAEKQNVHKSPITYWRLRPDPRSRSKIRREHRRSAHRWKSVNLRNALSIIQPIPIDEGSFWQKLGWGPLLRCGHNCGHRLEEYPFHFPNPFSQTFTCGITTESCTIESCMIEFK